MIGSRLDKYDIIEKVGEGGMATVYKGVHTALRRVVAIKVLHPHLSSAPRNRKRFAREAQTIEQLEHDNIVRIFDYSGSQADDCYIVTEFVPGQTLQQILEEEGLLSSEIVSLICVQLARGLAFAHKAGVIHRDIKPENVMVRDDGIVKLMDFGIAKVLEEVSVTMTGSLIGSPSYMSPESVLEGEPDLRSDLFSLGSLMFYMLSGQAPFSGKNPSVILRKVIEGDRPDLGILAPCADQRLITLVEGLLHPDVNSRIQSAEDVERVLEEVLESTLSDPYSDKWKLDRWIDNRTRFNIDLNEYLKGMLLTLGRECLDDDRPLDAKRHFNRLLSITPDDPEVMELLMDLSVPAEHAPKKWLSVVAALAAVGLLAVGIQKSMFATENFDATATEQNVGAAVEAVGDAQAPPTSIDEISTIETPMLDRDNLNSEVLVAPIPDVSAPVLSEVDGTQDAEIMSNPPSLSPIDQTDATDATDATDRTNEQIINTSVITQDSTEDAALAPTEPLMGTISIGLDPAHRGVWADVYVDGISVGRLRGGGSPHTIEVNPGEHIIQISNDYAITHREQVVLEAGATVDLLDIRLLRRPVTVRFPSTLALTCQVHNGEALIGTLQSLGYSTRLTDEELLSEIRIVCANGVTLGPYDIRQPLPGETVTFPP